MSQCKDVTDFVKVVTNVESSITTPWPASRTGIKAQSLMLAQCLCGVRRILRCIPPGLGAEQMLFLLGIFYCETTRADNDPVAVSIYQSLIRYPD